MVDFNSSIRVAVTGEALIDLISRADDSFEPCLGGSVYNLTRALARQGVPTLYLNPFSSDRFGQALARQISLDGAHLQHPEPVPQATSLAVVSVNAEGHPDYVFYREGVADRQVNSNALIAACADLQDLAFACTGCLALDPRDASIYLPWITAQRTAGRCVVIDANLRPSVMTDLDAYRKHVLRVLQEADVIKVSDEDIAYLGLQGNSALECAQELFNQLPNARLMALTMGSDGAWLVARGGKRWHLKEERSLTVIDTVGAGDCFLAGLLSALLDSARSSGAKSLLAFVGSLNDENALYALRHAIASASLCVQSRGCAPPDWNTVCSWREL